MPPKISIITVVYNGAETIGKSIESVLGQKYEAYEYLIVDGGSTDATIEIINNFKSDKIFCISETDNGIYDAMNKGVKRATGDWIYFLGCDDIFYNDHVLESIFLKAGLENINFIYGNIKSESYNKLYDGEFDHKKLLQKNISHQAIFYHKSIFSKIGLYKLNYKGFADWDFNLRCFENKEVKILFVNITIALFAAGGMSSTYDVLFLRQSLLPRKLEFLKSNKGTLVKMRDYDEWWRFLRNSGIRNIKDIQESGYTSSVPEVILSMIKWQNKIPGKALQNGMLSKLSMLASYFYNINKIRN